MANFEVLSLDPTTPQIRAPGAGDGYSVPRDMTFATGTTLNAPTTVVSVNTSTDALRITQVGAGNALLVEDSANPDASPTAITATGAVGIGTATPSTVLHVKGTVGGTDPTVVTGERVRIQSNDTTGRSAYMSLIAGTAANSGVLFGDQDAADVGQIRYLHSDNSMQFYTSSAERMRLDASGNLGLGVTPSAWASSRALQVGNASVFAISNVGFLGANAYYDGSYKYIAGGTAQVLEVNNSNEFRFLTATSGSAGGTISFTQAMTLDASGRLGVGTTSPAVNLEVQGTASLALFRNNTSSATTSYITVVNANNSSNGLVMAHFNDGTGYFGTQNNAALRFVTNDTERARITAGGYFKASNDGTYASSTDPYHELRSNQNNRTVFISNSIASGYTDSMIQAYFSGYSPNTTTSWFLYCSDTTAQRASIRSNGGLANYQANNVDLSDARTKNSITPAASMWDKVAALEIVTYKYNDQTHDDVNLGVIAQQVEAVEPVWVDNDGWGDEKEGEEPLKTVYTKDITFAAIKALQEAMARIEQLEAKVAALEAR